MDGGAVVVFRHLGGSPPKSRHHCGILPSHVYGLDKLLKSDCSRKRTFKVMISCKLIRVWLRLGKSTTCVGTYIAN